MTVTQHEDEKLGSERLPLLDLGYKLPFPCACIHSLARATFRADWLVVFILPDHYFSAGKLLSYIYGYSK